MKDDIKLDKNSRLIVRRVVNISIDNRGRKIKEFKEYLIGDEGLSLGSIKEPKDNDIINFEWEDTSPQKRQKIPFENMFR